MTHRFVRSAPPVLRQDSDAVCPDACPRAGRRLRRSHGLGRRRITGVRNLLALTGAVRTAMIWDPARCARSPIAETHPEPGPGPARCPRVVTLSGRHRFDGLARFHGESGRSAEVSTGEVWPCGSGTLTQARGNRARDRERDRARDDPDDHGQADRRNHAAARGDVNDHQSARPATPLRSRVSTTARINSVMRGASDQPRERPARVSELGPRTSAQRASVPDSRQSTPAPGPRVPSLDQREPRSARRGAGRRYVARVPAASCHDRRQA